MALKRFLMAGFVAAVLVACGDDDSSDFATRPSGDSSSACEDCDDSSSSKTKSSSSVKKSSSSSAKVKSSSSKARSSSSSAKSSSSEKGTEPAEVASSSSLRQSSASLSSSSAASSSSVVQPSSSVAYVEPCRTDSVDTCEYGTLTDERDGQTYKTVKIGDQVWMAENLNYRYIQQTAEEDSSSYCYNDAPANCAKYGRLYRWSAALVVCPEGWHLPTQVEWKALFDAVGGHSTAGIMLKSTEGWINNGNGSDAYFFSALPAGYRYYNGVFNYEGDIAYFWSSTERNSNDAYSMYLDYGNDNAVFYSYKNSGFSVRCLMD